MTRQECIDYNVQVIEYIKNFRNIFSEFEGPYDPGSVVELLDAVLEHIRDNFSEYDYEDQLYLLDPSMEEILKKIIKFIPISRQFKEEEMAAFEEETILLDKKAKQFIASMQTDAISDLKIEIAKGKLSAVKYLHAKYGLNLAMAKAVVEHLVTND